jgi:hypothetical protein
MQIGLDKGSHGKTIDFDEQVRTSWCMLESEFVDSFGCLFLYTNVPFISIIAKYQ